MHCARDRLKAHKYIHAHLIMLAKRIANSIEKTKTMKLNRK